MKKTSAASLVLLSLLAFACGKDDDDMNDGQVVEQIPDQLEGTYLTSCLPNSQLNLTHSTREISFSAAGDFDKKEVYFADACTGAPALVYKVVGTVQNPGKLPENQALDMINFQINEAYITPGTQTLVNLLNTTKLCGKQDWAVNVEASIAGLDCGDFAIAKGEVIQDVYEDRDGSLFFGKKFALLLNETNTERPKEADMSIAYKKQD